MGQLISLAEVLEAIEDRVEAIVICGWCGHDWLADIPFSADWHSLECPECGQCMGHVEAVCVDEYADSEECE